MKLPAEHEQALGAFVDTLARQLGANLDACVLYGSAVRGDLVAGVSDLNVLLILRESTPEAHAVIAEAIHGRIRIEPFILGRRGLERSFRAFAIKFRSIQRNYRVLHGADPLASLAVPDEIIRLECEQVLRNLRLRAVHAFVTFGSNGKRYSRYLIDVTADAFVALSEPARVEGLDVPAELAARVPVLGRFLDAEVSVLDDLLELKRRPRVLARREAVDFHGRLSRLLDRATSWMEVRWPT